LNSLYTFLTRNWAESGSDVTLQQAASVPYATIGVRLGSGPQNMMILTGEPNSGQMLWTAAGAAITTVDGRIVRTAGLPHNLGGLVIRNKSAGGGAPQEIDEEVDLPDLGLYGIPIECRDVRAGDETIRILGQDIHTYRIDETCASRTKALDWSFHNIYWRDPNGGLVWRSLQHISPNLDVIEIETLRPPA